MDAIGGTAPAGSGLPRLLVLGPVAVRGEDGAPRPLRGLAGRLLAGLVVRHPRPASRAELVDVLWPDGAPASAGSAFRVHLTRLRRALDEVGLEVRSEGDLLALPGADDAVDVLVAERLAARVRRSLRTERAPELAAVDAARALALFRGLAFDGIDGAPGLDAARVAAEDLRLDLEELAVEAELALGRPDEVVGRLEAMVEAEPLRERRWAQLLVAHYRSGRPSAALRVAQRARSTLVTLVGAEPGPELARLERSVLVHDPSLLATPPAPTSDEPPPQVGLVGRDDVLDQLAEASRSARVVTVVGSAGSGTSAVVSAFARERAPDQATAIRRCGADVLEGGADALVGPLDGSAAGDRPLLVLDLGSAAPDRAAAAVAEALSRSDALAVVVASRGALGLPDEVVLTLDPLDPPAAAALLGALVGAGHEASDLQPIADEVGGHPLSLRLAAGLVDVVGAAAVARDVASGDLSLTSGDDDVVTSVGSACEVLSPEAAEALALVAWFHGPVDVDAVRAVGRLDASAAAQALASWERAGLLERAGDAGRWRLPPAVRDALRALSAARGLDDEGRRRREAFLRDLVAGRGLASFGLDGPGTVAALGPWHDELVHLGDEAAAAGDVALVADLSAGLLWYWEAAGRTLDADRWFARRAAELDDRPPDGPGAQVLALAATSGPTMSRLVARSDLARRAVAVAEAADEPCWAALASIGVAADQVWSGDPEAADATLAGALAHLDEGWQVVAALLEALRALVHVGRGDLAGARAGLELVHQRVVDLGSTYGQVVVLLYLAWVAEAAGDVDRAVRCYEAAISVAEDEGRLDPDHARIGLSVHLLAVGRDADARAQLERALVGRLAAGDDRWAAECLCGIGEVAARSGAVDEAVTALRQAVQLAGRIGDASTLVRAGVALARLDLSAGRIEDAALVLGALEGSGEVGGTAPRGRDLAAADQLRAELALQLGGDEAFERGRRTGLAALVARSGFDLALGGADSRP